MHLHKLHMLLNVYVSLLNPPTTHIRNKPLSTPARLVALKDLQQGQQPTENWCCFLWNPWWTPRGSLDDALWRWISPKHMVFHIAFDPSPDVSMVTILFFSAPNMKSCKCSLAPILGQLDSATKSRNLQTSPGKKKQDTGHATHEFLFFSEHGKTCATVNPCKSMEIQCHKPTTNGDENG